MIAAAGPRPHGLEAAAFPSIQLARARLAPIRAAADNPAVDLDPERVVAQEADFRLCAVLCFVAARNPKRPTSTRRDLVGEGAEFTLIADEFHRAVCLL